MLYLEPQPCGFFCDELKRWPQGDLTTGLLAYWFIDPNFLRDWCSIVYCLACIKRQIYSLQVWLSFIIGIFVRDSIQENGKWHALKNVSNKYELLQLSLLNNVILAWVKYLGRYIKHIKEKNFKMSFERFEMNYPSFKQETIIFVLCIHIAA